MATAINKLASITNTSASRTAGTSGSNQLAIQVV
jgi:hypothetical protein